MNIQLQNQIAQANRTSDVYSFLNQAVAIIAHDYKGEGYSAAYMCRQPLMKSFQEAIDTNNVQVKMAIEAFSSALEYAIQDLEEADDLDEYYAAVNNAARG